MKKILSPLALFLFVFSVFADFADAQTEDRMPLFKPEVKRVAVFKNGYVFTYREGEARTRNGCPPSSFIFIKPIN